MTQYFVDSNNKYIGGFDGALPPDGSIEVPFPPKDARFEWDGTQWVEPPPLKDVFVDEKIDAQVVKQGVLLEDKVNALWLIQKGDKSEFERIDAIIEKAKLDNPK